MIIKFPLIVGGLVGAVYAGLTYLDLLLTRLLLDLPNTRELNPLVRTDDFAANYLPAVGVVAVIACGFLWSVRDQVRRYLITGQIVRIRFRSRPGDRPLDMSYGILLFCLIALFSRAYVVAQNTHAYILGENLTPNWFLFQWPVEVAILNPQARDFLFLVNLHLILTFTVFLPLAIFSIHGLVVGTTRLAASFKH